MTRDANDAATVILRMDYQPPAFWIDHVDLTLDLDPAKTRVLNKMTIRRNPDVAAQALRLDGCDLDLARVRVNGAATSFRLDGSVLVLANLPPDGSFELEIFNTCSPILNTRLMGLYVSHGTFFTQCEAEGFRRITYFLDRPDVMSCYTVTLRADRAQYPVLLSNGNLAASGLLDDGRHFATWVDPHRKPCYLFALVAGHLACREQRITTRSGSEHLLQVYVRPADIDKTEHALNALIKAIVWDTLRFGLTLDLDRFMIVATSDFNMGAMENKGLNIFNTQYVLASQATATDADFANVTAVVGHEYFHNWTGNRVTCRDWFQLSLKEGLTVFRDQEFSMDLCADAPGRAVKRIEDVRVLRTVQFAEDAGPMAHPVRPDSYVEINNFYTVTVYEKGAEVVRMMQTLVGQSGFAKGMTLYFERHDGHAVTCDDFVQAIADANPASALTLHLPQFKLWYSQAGTPRLTARGLYDAQAQRYTLDFSQSCPATSGQSGKSGKSDNQPFVIPISLGLVDASGRSLRVDADIDTHTHTDTSTGHNSLLMVVTHAQQSITFDNMATEPVPSILRGLSAPVILDFDYTDAQLLILLEHDPDPFNRWEAGQRLGLRCAMQAIANEEGRTSNIGPNNSSEPRDPSDPSDPSVLTQAFISAMRSVLRHPTLDAAFKELVLTLPSETYIAEQLDRVDPQQLHRMHTAMRSQLATALQPDWQWAYETHASHRNGAGGYQTDAQSTGRRALAGLALHHLCLAACSSNDAVWPGKTWQQFKDAGNMTDRWNALSALVHSGHPLADKALARFYAQYHTDDLVLDKWFALQAGACDRGGQVLPLVRQLLTHKDFHLHNPNRARSVIFSYCCRNFGAFHRTDAAGYAFWSEQVLALDAINPHVAARLARAMDRWNKLADPYRSDAHQALLRVAAHGKLSPDVREVVSRALTYPPALQ